MKKYILVVFGLVMAVSCTKKFTANKPAEFYEKVEIAREHSSVNLLTSFSVIELQKLANSKLPELLYEDNNIADDNYIIKVFRKGEVQIRPNGSITGIKIPLKVYIKARLNMGFISAEQDANFELDVNYVTRVSATPDWKLITKTSSNGFQWVVKPTIKVGPVELDVTPFVEKILDEQQDAIALKIDAFIPEKIPVKEYIQKAWELIQTPQPVSDEYNAWVKISPLEVDFIQPFGNSQKISTGVEIRGIAETFIGEKPLAGNIPLPVLSPNGLADSSFTINLIAQMPFVKASELIKKNLKDKVFSSPDNKYTVKIEDIDLYGSGDKVVVKTLLSGDIAGTIYLKGIPYYDTTSGKILIRKLDFDLDTKNKLLKAANWLSHDYFVKKIQSTFSFPIKAQIDEAKSMFQKNISKNKINSFITLDGRLDDIIPQKMFIAEDRFLVQIMAKGVLNLNISVADF